MSLLQLNAPDFVDFPWEPLPVGRNGWGRVGWEERRGEQEEKLWLEYKVKLK